MADFTQHLYRHLRTQFLRQLSDLFVYRRDERRFGHEPGIELSSEKTCIFEHLHPIAMFRPSAEARSTLCSNRAPNR
jgi:hypothetical protein